VSSDPPPLPPRPPAKEHRMFLPYGKYGLEANCEIHKCHPIQIPNFLFDSRTSASLGFVIPRKEETDAKSALVTLSYAGDAKLHLCLATSVGGAIEGLVTSEVLGSLPKPIKGVQAVARCASSGGGFGPQVLNVSQPISLKGKLFVTDMSLSDPRVFLKCNPVVQIWFFNGLYKTYRPLITPAMLEGSGGEGKTWFVCDMRTESDSKMGKESMECIDQNKIINEAYPAFGSD